MDTKNETDINYHWPREDKIRYMIEVMQAYLDGERVVYMGTSSGDGLTTADRDFGGVLYFGFWNPCAQSFPQYEIRPEEPKKEKKKKAVWSVEYKSGPAAGGFVSLEALLDFLTVTHLTGVVSGISRDVWGGDFALSGDGSLIADPYDLLEDF